MEGEPPRAFCPACLWRDFAEEETARAAPAAAGALFAVEGHDVLAEIARGGGGIVYRARQLRPAREVALKMLLPQQVAGERAIAAFRVEAGTVAALNHPAILPVYVVGEHRGMPFFTMKLAAGGTLAARRDSYRARWREIARLVVTLADAVQFAHSRGVIHRDLKPGNVLFDETGRVYVADFGLAKFVGGDLAATQTVHVFGTPAYLAPEVALGGARAATTVADVYGLGTILYELLAGRAPFAADSLPSLLRRIAEEPPPPLSAAEPRVPDDLATIAQRALAKEPARRFATPADLAADLGRWLDGRPIRSRPVGAAERLWRWARRNPALAAVSAGLIGAVLAGTGLLAAGNRALRGALEHAQAAEDDARGKLHTALVSEARLLRQSRRLGQRFKALKALEDAARLAPTAEVRSETASALALPDLRLVRTLPAQFANDQSTVDFTPDFTAYLVTGPDGSLVLRDLRDGAVRRTYRPRSGHFVRGWFSGDGTRFVAWCTDDSQEFWRVDGDRADWRLERATQAALHPSRPWVVYRRGDSELVERDLATGAERTVKSGGVRVFSLSYSPAADRLALVRDDSIEMIDATTGVTQWQQPLATIGLRTAWSADGQWIATGIRDSGDITVRESASGRPLRTLAGHTTYADFVRFYPERWQTVSAAFDRSLRLWDYVSGQELLRARFASRGLGVSPDGRELAVADEHDRLGVWAWADSRVFRELDGATGVQFGANFGLDSSRDGEWLVGGTDLGQLVAGTNSIRIWDVRRETETASFEVPVSRGKRSSVVFHPDGGSIAYSTQSTGVRARSFTVDADRRVTLGEDRIVSTGGELLLGINAAGDWYVNRAEAGVIAVWPRGDPAAERQLLRQAENPEPIVVSADLRWAVTLPYAKPNVRVWSLAEPAAPPRRLPIERAARVQFSPDGRTLLAGTAEGYATWSLPGLEPGPKWDAEPDGNPWRVFAFSPDGEWLACEATRAKFEIRSARDCRVLVRLEPPLDLEVSQIRWAPDASRLYLHARGPRVFVWDLAAVRRELAARGLDW